MQSQHLCLVLEFVYHFFDGTNLHTGGARRWFSNFHNLTQGRTQSSHALRSCKQVSTPSSANRKLGSSAVPTVPSNEG